MQRSRLQTEYLRNDSESDKETNSCKRNKEAGASEFVVVHPLHTPHEPSHHNVHRIPIHNRVAGWRVQISEWI
jgi:hypothetical protein